jgi:hypothetical protein
LALLALPWASVCATVMVSLVAWFRRRWLEKLRQQKALVKAGKLAGFKPLMRVLCWFLDV